MDTPIENIITEFFKANPEAIGVFLIDFDGNPLYSYYYLDKNSENPFIQGIIEFDLKKNEKLFAFNSILTILLLKKGKFEAETKELEIIYIVTEYSKMLFKLISENIVLLVIYSSEMKAGLDHFGVYRLADKIKNNLPSLDKNISKRNEENSINLMEKLDQLEQSLLHSIGQEQEQQLDFNKTVENLEAKIFVMYPLSDFNSLQINDILNKLSENNPSLEIHYFHKDKQNITDSLIYFLENIEWCDVFFWIHTKNSKLIEYKIAHALRKKILVISNSIYDLPSYIRIKCLIDTNLITDELENPSKDSLNSAIYQEILSGLKNLILEYNENEQSLEKKNKANQTNNTTK
ncbi:MAG: hypothetical protein ACTSRZ_09955 [Promethearchaeota archaeon]